MNKILVIKNLSFGYSEKPVLENVNLEIESGTFTALIGKNGTGKSTLFNLILGNLQPATGEIYLFGTEIRVDNHYRRLAYISQDSLSKYKDFPTTVEELVKVELRAIGRMRCCVDIKKKANIGDYLALMDLRDHAKHKLNELSGGQLQRLALLLAIVKDAEFILLDEPTSGIDKEFTQELFSRLSTLAKTGKTIFMATHSLREASQWVDQVVGVRRNTCSLMTKEEVEQELAYDLDTRIV